MNINKKAVYIVLALSLFIGFTVYYLNINSPEGVKENPNIEGKSEASQINKTITLGIISDDAVKQIKELKPTADYIAFRLSDNKTRYDGKVVVVRTIDNLTDLLIEKKVDLFITSPFTAIVVLNKTNAVPFLRGWRDDVAEYHTVFFVNKNSSINKMDEFAGKSIAFPNEYSSSSYLLPKAYLIQNDFNVSLVSGKNNIRYNFSGSDEATILWVIEGKTDIGALSNLDFENLPDAVKEKLKIIVRTADVPRHIVSYRADLDPVLVESIKQILLNIDKDPQAIEAMKLQRTKKYDMLSKSEISNFTKLSELVE